MDDFQLSVRLVKIVACITTTTTAPTATTTTPTTTTTTWMCVDRSCGVAAYVRAFMAGKGSRCGCSSDTHRYLNGVGNHLRQFHIGIVLLEYGHIGAGVQRKQTRTTCLRKISAHIFPDFRRICWYRRACHSATPRYARKFDSRFRHSAYARSVRGSVCLLYIMFGLYFACSVLGLVCPDRNWLSSRRYEYRRWPDGNGCSAFAQNSWLQNKIDSLLLLPAARPNSSGSINNKKTIIKQRSFSC